MYPSLGSRISHGDLDLVGEFIPRGNDQVLLQQAAVAAGADNSFGYMIGILNLDAVAGTSEGALHAASIPAMIVLNAAQTATTRLMSGI